MLKTRWVKVLTDIWGNKTRTLLVVLSVGVGVFAVGFVQTLSTVLISDMKADYQKVNANSGMVGSTEALSEDFILSLRYVPGVERVEGRGSVDGKIDLGAGKSATIMITSFESLEDMKIDRIRPNTPNAEGELSPLGTHEIYLERSAVNMLNVKPGDKLAVKLKSGRVRELKVAQIVYDITSMPFIFTNMATAYTTPDTMVWLEGDRDFNSVVFTVKENKTDRKHVTDIAEAIVKRIENDAASRRRAFAMIMDPGRHWASDLIEALSLILQVLGYLAVVMSGFLVVNTINGLMAQHVRQIGIMKAIGGSIKQIISMYLMMILLYGILAAIFAIPIAAFLGYNVAIPVASMLNFNLSSFKILPHVMLLQLIIAILVPLVTALVPVMKGVSITAREALSDYGIGPLIAGQSWIDRVMERVKNISRPMLISLRNTFRRKGRLMLTLSALTLGGAIFIGIFNVRSSMNKMVDDIMGYFLSDVNVFLQDSYRVERIEPLLNAVPNISSIEGWLNINGKLQSPDKRSSIDVEITAPPADSKLITPVIVAGRWIVPEDENAIVIGNSLKQLRPELKIGDDIVIKINDEESTWRIVGEFQMAGGGETPTLYANNRGVAMTIGQLSQYSQFRISTTSHDLFTQDRVIRELNQIFDSQGIKVGMIMSGVQIRSMQSTMIDTIIALLVVMSIVIAAVGGLGLMGTMSMNVMERTKEIAVMRSFGASDKAVLRLVLVEGVLIGLISWLLGIILAFPITILLNNLIGTTLMRSPLDFVLSMNGFLIWFGIVVVISALASALPARNASRMTIREALAYE